MADAAPNSFENLSHSGIFRINSKDDKNVSLSLDVYMGNASIVVFTGAGGKPWKLTLPPKILFNLGILLKKMRAEPRPCREPMFINEWVEGENKKGSMKQKGNIGFGIDDNLMLFIDVAANDLQGRHIFPVKPDGRYDFSNTSFSEKDTLIANIDYLIDCFTNQAIQAIAMSRFKRTGGQGGNKGSFGGGGGGNRGGYGGNQGGGNNYGGGQRQQQSGTFGGGADVENDLHV